MDSRWPPPTPRDPPGGPNNGGPWDDWDAAMQRLMSTMDTWFSTPVMRDMSDLLGVLWPGRGGADDVFGDEPDLRSRWPFRNGWPGSGSGRGAPGGPDAEMSDARRQFQVGACVGWRPVSQKAPLRVRLN